MKTLADLEKIKNKTLDKMNIRADREEGIRIVVGMATCGIAAGARPVLNAVSDEVSKRNLKNVVVSQTGCIGVCRLEPIMEVYAPGKDKVTYVKMDAEKAVKVVAEHIVNNRPIKEYTIGEADK
ncbi:MAG: NADP-reducing hydrogenase subunit HndB [Firmicutes bacterium ADurb.Bin193]|nr:MAG: NADP-reducing hydrogenase subunit HndB [Firmicutes bacterium ADurb.Bin193]